ncbi:MAG: hypothetical protein H0W02_22045 [Ktedonobacteraceae bacterium]|nr:hypothetical protein [Ktedonobacteraceae bacterium]
MDVYRALNADVPELLFTVLHQAGPAVAAEDYIRTVSALHMDIRRQAREVSEALRQWSQLQYARQAEETAQKLQRRNLLAEQADLSQVQATLDESYQRLGNRIGSTSVVGLQGSAEEVYSNVLPADPDLARRVTAGHEYLASLGFQPGQGVLQEMWLLFRGSVHYDVMEHIVRDRLGLDQGSAGRHIENVARAPFSTYNLVYQVGEGLLADLPQDAATQEVSFAFNKGSFQYSPFRQDVAALMEHIAERQSLLHASFWQRRLGLGTGKEFMLRLRLPDGELPLRELIDALAGASYVGKEMIVEGGKLLLGKRAL